MEILITSGNSGFGHNWILKAYGKQFYLGQDVKFCSRVLGMSSKEVINQIGTNRLDLKVGRQKLAKFICSQLGINRSNANKMESWGLAAD
jgi:hypothetical protein